MERCEQVLRNLIKEIIVATELTNPIDQPAATHQAITRVDFSIPHKRNATDDGMTFNKDVIQVRYEVTTYDATGKAIGVKSRTVPFSSWPAAFINESQDVYAMVATDARANNLLADGTDEALNA